MSGQKLARILPRFNRSSFASTTTTRLYSVGSSDAPYSRNDEIAPRIRNRNPLNLEMMRIGRKPQGFRFEEKKISYWNRLTLEISGSNTTAEVTHWTGRKIAVASTTETSIRNQLFNKTDAAAVQAVAKIISQRCLESGISEVFLDVDPSELEKDKMKKFIQIIEDSGLSLSEPDVYEPHNPYKNEFYEMKPKAVKPWTVTEQE
eukprot:TRINITY_DN4796_c0_g1_i10.p1 TRINITY_DN4796_c0_g1~~TRINITY_DN4796_c0_g1_i10.p1  ORF type:complete len:204 (+),score=35.13 TRINITY_DN4796_c0_g1_i10:42-653(+)